MCCFPRASGLLWCCGGKVRGPARAVMRSFSSSGVSCAGADLPGLAGQPAR